MAVWMGEQQIRRGVRFAYTPWSPICCFSHLIQFDIFPQPVIHEQLKVFRYQIVNNISFFFKSSYVILGQKPLMGSQFSVNFAENLDKCFDNLQLPTLPMLFSEYNPLKEPPDNAVVQSVLMTDQGFISPCRVGVQAASRSSGDLAQQHAEQVSR